LFIEKSGVIPIEFLRAFIFFKRLGACTSIGYRIVMFILIGISINNRMVLSFIWVRFYNFVNHLVFFEIINFYYFLLLLRYRLYWNYILTADLN
jgi:hypothetical protein